jgi:hypothetical protein
MPSAWHIPCPMKRKNPAAVALGRKGGHTRMKKMSPQQRTILARLAANARWAKKKGESGSHG